MFPSSSIVRMSSSTVNRIGAIIGMDSNPAGCQLFSCWAATYDDGIGAVSPETLPDSESSAVCNAT